MEDSEADRRSVAPSPTRTQKGGAQPLKRFWLSWTAKDEGPFTLWSPWWISGAALYTDGKDILERPTICAAVIAPDEDAAKGVIRAAHDKPPLDLEWRFCNERPQDWSPFCDRFPRGDWMKWPSPQPGSPPQKETP